MGASDLDMVDHNGARALCRFMYTKYGFSIHPLHDGGNSVYDRAVATAMWERLRLWQTGKAGGREAALGGWPSSVKPADQKAVWCSLVRALPLVEEWLFWTGRDPPLNGAFL